MSDARCSAIAALVDSCSREHFLLMTVCFGVQRDERVLVVWSDSIDTIIPTCHDFEERLIKLLWRSRPGAFPGSHPTSSTSHPASVSGESLPIVSRP